MTNRLLSIYSFITIILFSIIVSLSLLQEEGIYGNALIGAVYEILWLPLLISITVLPFIWGHSLWKNKVDKLKGLSFIGVFILLFSSLFILF
ncbi:MULTISPECIES: hypothetical protein [unclassified Myroides]|uniref:hypothetical protein n=1 Tax=unclassified Myroides TaxID=2642485 RepID=UPI001303A71D